MAARKPLIAGNWKMFGRRGSLAEIASLWALVANSGGLDIVVCPPAVYVRDAVEAAGGTGIAIGGQDCSPASDDGARTGEVSANMLADVGARYVIVGHSERRTGHAESDALVKAKAAAVVAAGMVPIICVGETRDERSAGLAASVVARQVLESTPTALGDLVLAYEPVWAIGAQVTPSVAEIAEIHAVVRNTLSGMIGDRADRTRILYGGSVSPKNATEVFSAGGVDGALVGRASLKAADFAAIILGHPAAM
ncbi:MAG: triose-phosphate isomerase [Hyphomonadaceae bacterium]|nr:triose-phosphate isomerase [Hyphomonadaceae bacterium]